MVTWPSGNVIDHINEVPVRRARLVLTWVLVRGYNVLLMTLAHLHHHLPYAIGPLSALSICLSVTLVYCGHTVGWTKMLLGTEVDLSPSDIVLDGGQLPPKSAQPPIFCLCLLWPNGWMDQDAIWYGGRPWPRPHCVRWGPSSPGKGHSPPPLFRLFHHIQDSVSRLRSPLV